MVADSGFPAVYERIPVHATLRAQVVWVLGMAFVFLYAVAWRPLVTALGRRHATGCESTRWSEWLAGIASAMNLLFLVVFPFAFFGRMEGGVPAFLYGVPVAAACLLFIPLVSAMLALAAVVTVVWMWRDAQASAKARIQHSIVVLALLAFVVFAWYWRLTPASLLT